MSTEHRSTELMGSSLLQPQKILRKVLQNSVLDQLQLKSDLHPEGLAELMIQTSDNQQSANEIPDQDPNRIGETLAEARRWTSQERLDVDGSR